MKDNEEAELRLETIKKRIKKLLALSKSPNENEAVAALKKAQMLMEEYCLSENECVYTHHSIKATKRLSRWRTVLSNAVAWLYYCETYRNAASGEIVFYGEEFEAFMAGEMYRYLSKTIERMAKQNIRKGAALKYRDKYKLGIACQLYIRIQEMGKAASWAPQRDIKLLAVKKAMESQLTIVCEDMTLGGLNNAAFRKGATAGYDISLNRQTTGHGGRYLEGKA
jgi:hypothetical protein